MGRAATRSISACTDFWISGTFDGSPTTCMRRIGSFVKSSIGSTDRIARAARAILMPGSSTQPPARRGLGDARGRMVGVDQRDVVAMTGGGEAPEQVGRQNRIDSLEHGYLRPPCGEIDAFGIAAEDRRALGIGTPRGQRLGARDPAVIAAAQIDDRPVAAP